MESILVVCTGNICRSPVGELALRSLLPEKFIVSSSGTHAALDRPTAPETDEFVFRTLGIKLDHVGQQLTRERAEAADLIITMTVEHRAWVARTAPRAVRRTFTLREMEEVLTHVAREQHFETLRALAIAASRLRSRVVSEGKELDISDPYGGPPEGYESSFRQVLASSHRVACSISRYVAGTTTSHF